MKRVPSVHITEEILARLISKFLTQQGSNRVVLAKDLAVFLVKEGRGYTLRHRSILHPNLKVQKTTNRIISSPKALAFEFSTLLTLARKKLKHQGLKVIKEGDGVQWQFIVEAAGLATQFCKDNDLEIRPGFVEYINISLSIIKPFTLTRFKSNHDRVQQHYLTLKEIEADPNEQKTKLIFDIYQQKVFEKTGINFKYKEIPAEYVHFVRASVIAKEIDCHPKHFVTAQFDQLDFTNGYPTPSQLDSFKAKERAVRWLTENDIKVKKHNKVLNKRQLDFLKKHGA